MRVHAAAAVALLLAAAAPARGGSGPTELLAEAIRYETISPQDESGFEPGPFLAFHDFLERSFPRVREALVRRVVGGYSLLYEWPGSETALLPVLLTAHFDVVPVPEAQRDTWEQPPFAGVVEGGFVWGRGAIDDKAGVIAILAAVEQLLAEGHRPVRTVYLAFGHDEEVGGAAGAGATARWLEEEGVRLLFSLDEGMAITEGAVPGVARPVALIGIAEKGYLTLELTAHAPGGHSSTPPPSGAIGRLSRAIARLEDNPQPARMGGVVEALFDATAPHMAWLPRMVLQNRWLTASLVESQLSAHPASNALIRTTTAATMISGGVKENVLPPEATAVVNFRIVPGDTSEAVVARVRDIVDDPDVMVEVRRATEPSPVADVGSPSYALLEETIRAVAPDAVVAPGLVLGGTDTKHYQPLAENSYRFTPFRLGPEDLPRIHGANERVAVQNLEEELVPFYVQLVRGLDGLPQEATDALPLARRP